MGGNSETGEASEASGAAAAAASSIAGKNRRSNKGKNRVPLRALARVSSVAAGVQFGWALQLSLLTPYVEELGIPHAWASYIWLCGPISGILVQPLIGHLSDRCQNSWGRRRPFILLGASLVVLAVLTIAFSADIGFALGDNSTSRPHAIVVFVIGFWILDLANNTLQGPCRALLADFTGKDHRRSRRANAFFSLFMAIGNVLGYATGAYNSWYKIFTFTMTKACNESCANLKAAFLLAIIILILTTFLSVTAASEIPWLPSMSSNQQGCANPTVPLLSIDVSAAHLTSSLLDEGSKQAAVELNIEAEEEDVELEREAFLWEVFGTLKDFPKPMRYILLVTALTWFAWFPFILFDTDWMGREVYLGDPSTTDPSLTRLYNQGVRAGSLGLMLNSIILGVTSLLIEPMCRRIGQRKVWAAANMIMSVCFCGTAIVTMLSSQIPRPELQPPPAGILVSALLIFAILGAPLAVTYSVPYAMATAVTNTTGGGQGLSMGVLNLAVVFPQIIISVGSGPWDELFGGGNMPAFLLAAVAASISGILAAVLLPTPPSDNQSDSVKHTPMN